MSEVAALNFRGVRVRGGIHISEDGTCVFKINPERAKQIIFDIQDGHLNLFSVKTGGWTPEQEEWDNRNKALNLAKDVHAGSPADQIVAAAELYYQFVNKPYSIDAEGR